MLVLHAVPRRRPGVSALSRWRRWHSTSLNQIIRRSIQASGPLSVASYMALCLSHPHSGYYPSRDSIGSSGDFITSPEISQIFGELLAIWFLSVWRSSKRPGPIRLIELGPGRGTLMADMIRTLCQFSDAFKALESVHLVEMSHRMGMIQKGVLSSFSHLKLAWATHLDEIDHDYPGYTMLVAHEFFDALPVVIFVKKDDGFHELKVDLDPSGAPDDQNPGAALNLRYALSPSPTPLPLILDTILPDISSLEIDAHLELSPTSFTTMQQMSKITEAGKGAALVVDYGYQQLEIPRGIDTFRAFKSHRQVHPLSTPGEADLTSSVNFALLKEAVSQSRHKAFSHGPISQNSFLLGMGLEARLQMLLSNAPSFAHKQRITSAASRLIDSNLDGMGQQYLVLALTGSGDTVWPFEPHHYVTAC